MKSIIFRILAVALGIGALAIAIFKPDQLQDSALLIARNIFFGLLLLTYGCFGSAFLAKIPILNFFVEKSDSSNDKST